MSNTPIIAHYHIHAPFEQAQSIALFIAYEQTVELPAAFVSHINVAQALVGQIINCQPIHEQCTHVSIAYMTELASQQLPQLLNLLYGNISMLSNVRLYDVTLPENFLQHFVGPRFGIQKLREKLGVFGRPLLASAIKPRGLSISELAQIAHDFALGGGDLIKDDQNLVSKDFADFKARVQACADAVDRANQQTGRQCLYFPHLAAPHQELERYAAWIHQIGLQGALLCPAILGLDTARDLTARYDLLYMAHPALSGVYTQNPTHGIDMACLMGTLWRLGGADIVIFPGHGGRFGHTLEQCQATSNKLRAPLGALAPAWPCPAGGMQFQQLSTLSKQYGKDTVFLIGGALQQYHPQLTRSTQAFLHEINQSFQPQLSAPQQQSISACEWPAAISETLKIETHLPFQSDWQWVGRTITAYKQDQTLDFSQVKRIELIGNHGEITTFELRYFEVAPGGYTSLEKHLHTHVLITVRGQGILSVNNTEQPMQMLDLAYIAPMQVHQLLNTGQEPFGFFCIVDKVRDRPMPPQ